ncbi:MAG: single-stranded DNA-binding protein [Spirochaetae bacterium HGW-Spirochaetae-5]|nr:MAG: single-stranded DNA-binding protein [Spirochaetae bacterium HGW-Spirochaetae-5]
MATDINRVLIIGRLTRDPEMRYTPAGTAVCSFAVANSKTYSQNGEKKEQVSFIDCVAWAKLAEVIVEYCRKGYRVAIDGKLVQRRWQDDSGNTRSKLEVQVENIQLLQGKTGETQKQPAAETGNMFNGTDVSGEDFENPFADDDIPF